MLQCESCLFSKDLFFQDFITLALGMYNSIELSVGENVMNVYKRILEQNVYESCSKLYHKRAKEDACLFDQLFFLNPEQMQVRGLSKIDNSTVVYS